MTDQELIEYARKLRTDLCEALPNGVGNTIDALADALQSRIAEVAQFCAIIDKTDDEGFSPEIEQELMDLRAALSLQRRV